MMSKATELPKRPQAFCCYMKYMQYTRSSFQWVVARGPLEKTEIFFEARKTGAI